MGSILFLGLMMGMLYAIMIRPQQKRMKEHQALLRDLGEGDLVVTASGVHGAIAEVDGDIIWLEVAPEVELKLDRQSIARRIVDVDDDEDDDEDADVDDEYAEDEA